MAGGKRKGRKKAGGPRAPAAASMAIGDARVVHGVGVTRVAERIDPKDPRNPSGRDAWLLQVVDWSSGKVIRAILLPDGAQVEHRPAADPNTARAMLSELEAERTPPPPESWDLRYDRFRKVLIEGDPIAGAVALRELYAIPDRNFGAMRLTDAFEQLVLAEITLALGGAFSDLRARLHARWLPAP